MRPVTLIGNFTLDLTDRGPTPGGSAFYAGCAAAAIGAPVRIAAAVTPDFPIEQVLARMPADLAISQASRTATFRNEYKGCARTQYLRSQGDPISRAAIPAGWPNDGIMLLCPILDEIQTQTACLRGELTGACLQGWLRTADPAGRIVCNNDPAFLDDLAGVDVLFYSEEDVAGATDLQPRIAGCAPVVVCTRGPNGAVITIRGVTHKLVVDPVEEVDATGAGDTYAAAFMLEYAHSGDPLAAARFAATISVIQVQHPGPLAREMLVGKDVCLNFSN